MSDETRPLDATVDRPAPAVVRAFAALSPSELADVLELPCVMRHEIRPLWAGLPRIAGPAFTVRTARHDDLMLHAAIYLARRDDIIVVEAGDDEMAVAGGNVCAIAQRRGVAGLIVDGVVREVRESRERRFPVFARGTSPMSARRVGDGGMNVQIRCGGAVVAPGDVVVADEEGIVVVPRARTLDVLERAQERVSEEDGLSLDDRERHHRSAVEAALRTRGYRLG